ncbi:MAG: sigma-70 family RNA polymerase sigma factor [Aeromicrobium sp.]
MSPEALAREGYARHGGELFRFAMSRLGDEGLAQDAVQETILRAWRSGGSFDPSRASLRTWLYAIMRNVVIDLAARRRRTSLLTSTLALAPGGEDMSDHTGSVMDADLITRALGALSDDHRIAIVETYLRDRPYDEVAGELGVSLSTLRSRVFYGLKQLRLTIEKMVAES